MMRTRLRFRARGALLLAAALATGTALAACSGDGGANSADGPVTIRFAWWGSDDRARTTREVIAAFETANPDIKVEAQTSAFDAYFDKLATDTAAGDAPDVMTLGGAYPREYSDRGALLDLSSVSDTLATSNFSEGALDAGKFDDTLYGIPTGGNAIGVVLNPAVFKAAGVEIPDTSSWTWEQFTAAADAVSAAGKGTTFGFEPRVNDTLGVYAAQRGTPIFDAAGKLGVAAETIQNYWELEQKLLKSGGIPPAETITELAAVDPAQTLMGQGKAAMTVAYSNLLGTYIGSSDLKLEIAPLPGERQFARPGATVLPSQYYAISSKSEHPQAAAKLIDYLVNSTEAGKKILDDRGLPFNTEVRTAIQAQLDESGKAASDYLAVVEKNGAPPVPIPPAGGSSINDTTSKLDSDVLFGKKTPAQASKEWHEAMTSALASAS